MANSKVFQRTRRLVFGAAVVATISGCSALATPGPPAPATPVLPPVDARQAALGRRVYLQSCASCHGQNGQGAPNWQQPDTRGNMPAPPHDDSGHTWRHGDAQLAEIIRDGLRDPFNKTPELTMPPFKDRLNEEEIAAVKTYFKSLWSPEHRIFQEERNQEKGTSRRGGR